MADRYQANQMNRRMSKNETFNKIKNIISNAVENTQKKVSDDKYWLKQSSVLLEDEDEDVESPIKPRKKD
jgi:hypothetical protein